MDWKRALLVDFALIEPIDDGFGLDVLMEVLHGQRKTKALAAFKDLVWFTTGVELPL